MTNNYSLVTLEKSPTEYSLYKAEIQVLLWKYVNTDRYTLQN